MELAPGLHRIGSDIVAVHLIVTDDGITVIDAGLPGHWRELKAELATLGRSVDDIRGVVLTHGDIDHIGFAERLRRDHGIPVYVHEADAARAMGAKPPATPPDPRRLGPVLEFAWYAIRRGAARVARLTNVIEVRDGDVPAVGAVFVGDALTTRSVLTGETGAQPAPFTDDRTQARASLDRLEGLQASWVLPGHGAPWTAGVEPLLRELRRAGR
jgi:glyoxylase-like metal-dependent hydrolase (beta-lactamase superfamily II)